MVWQVWCDHQVVGEHKVARHWVDQNGGLRVLDMDERPHYYEAGTWHAIGTGFQCAYGRPNPSCPNCGGGA